MITAMNMTMMCAKNVTEYQIANAVYSSSLPLLVLAIIVVPAVIMLIMGLATGSVTKPNFYFIFFPVVCLQLLIFFAFPYLLSIFV